MDKQTLDRSASVLRGLADELGERAHENRQRVEGEVVPYMRGCATKLQEAGNHIAMLEARLEEATDSDATAILNKVRAAFDKWAAVDVGLGTCTEGRPVAMLVDELGEVAHARLVELRQLRREVKNKANDAFELRRVCAALEGTPCDLSTLPHEQVAELYSMLTSYRSRYDAAYNSNQKLQRQLEDEAKSRHATEQAAARLQRAVEQLSGGAHERLRERHRILCDAVRKYVLLPAIKRALEREAVYAVLLTEDDRNALAHYADNVEEA